MSIFFVSIGIIATVLGVRSLFEKEDVYEGNESARSKFVKENEHLIRIFYSGVQTIAAGIVLIGLGLILYFR